VVNRASSLCDIDLIDLQSGQPPPVSPNAVNCW
jgi:hypothetical protein